MQYYEPNFLDEALVLLDRFGDRARILAGGTLLVPRLRSDPSGADALVNVKRIGELAQIRLEDGKLRIGALATAGDIAGNALVRDRAKMVAQAAASIGARQLRNVATIGGNVCSGHPAADLAAALLAHDAVCAISNVHEGPSELPIERFFRAEGHALHAGELLTALLVPLATVGMKSTAPTRRIEAYQKMLTRRAFEMALVSVAVCVELENGRVDQVRIALGGAAPRPIRATAAEAVLAGQPLDEKTIQQAARAAAQADAAPQDDRRASADYRRHLVAVLTERALADAAFEKRRGLD